MCAAFKIKTIAYVPVVCFVLGLAATSLPTSAEVPVEACVSVVGVDGSSISAGGTMSVFAFGGLVPLYLPGLKASVEMIRRLLPVRLRGRTAPEKKRTRAARRSPDPRRPGDQDLEQRPSARRFDRDKI